VRCLAFAAFWIGCGGAPPAPAATPHHDPSRHHGHHHDFSDADRWALQFDSPDRTAWQKPEEVVALLNLARGARIADIGAGTGYFLPYLSRAVGPDGRVLALDVEPAMVDHMTKRASRDGLTNVTARRIATDDPKLAPATVERILIVNTWHHISDRTSYAAKLRTALVPCGLLAVVDFTLDSPIGPPVAARLPPDIVAGELRTAGFATTSIAQETLPRQYVILAEAPGCETTIRK
jgi:SAM-dependent methyltransferase